MTDGVTDVAVLIAIVLNAIRAITSTPATAGFGWAAVVAS